MLFDGCGFVLQVNAVFNLNAALGSAAHHHAVTCIWCDDCCPNVNNGRVTWSKWGGIRTLDLKHFLPLIIFNSFL